MKHIASAAPLLVLFCIHNVSAQDKPRKSEPEHKFVYSLPYKKIAPRISRHIHGDGKGRWGIDFVMKRGTPIYAVRDGVVEKAVEKHKEVPKAEKKAGAKRGGANKILIRHPDRTSSSYIHLQHEGVVVKKGQRVKKGQLIGYSGNTGKSSGPHLHFCVYAGGRKGSIRVKFQTENHGITYLEKGTRYRNPPDRRDR